jgi:hypothetical protein
VGGLVIERLGIVSVLTVVFVSLTTARSTTDSDYKKICLVSQNLRVLDDSDDTNSCRAIAVGSQAPSRFDMLIISIQRR